MVTEHAVPAAAVAVHEWFRRDVEDRLAAVVGGRARLRVVVLLACVLALDSADKATVGAIAAELEPALHIGDTRLGLLVAVSTGIGAVATLPAGMLVDRMNRVRLLAGTIVVWSAAMVASGFAQSFLMLLMTRLALGAVVAMATPAVASLTGDLFPPGQRGRIYGYILFGELLGFAVGFLIAGYFAGVLSWRFSFWVLALPGLVLAWTLLRLLPEPARGGQSQLSPGAEEVPSAQDVDAQEVEAQDVEARDAEAPERGGDAEDAAAEAGDEDQVEEEVEEQHVPPRPELVLRADPSQQSLWWAVRHVLSIPTNRFLIAASALGYFYFAGLQTFAVVYLRGRFGLSQSSATTLLLVIGIGAIAGVLSAGWVADRLIARGYIPARMVVAGAAFLVAAGLFLPGLFAGSVLVAVPLFFLGAAGLGGANPPLDAARLDVMHFQLWGRAEAVRTVFRSSFQAIAPLLFGFVSGLFGGSGGGSPGLQRAFLIMLAVLLGAGVLLLVGRRTYPRDVASALASSHDRHDTPARGH